MPGRKFNGGYRYGFNGKENDNEVKGDGNQQDYGMRIYDPRLGRFLSVDPITAEYPELTPFQFASNNPIAGIDLDGLEFFYAADGNFLGRIGTSQQVFTADRIETKTREVTDISGNKKIEKYKEAINPKSLNINHDKFQVASYVIMQEGLSQSSTEYLWIAHTNNNNAKASKKSFSDLLLGSYSSVKNKTALSDKNSSNRANYARAGTIDVLLGNADPTGGARFWDGIDFIAWGLNSPNGTPQNKFEDFKSLNISKDIFNTYLSSAKSFYPKGYNYQIGKDANGKKKYFHSDIPNAVFTDLKNWSSGNFLYNTGVKNQPGLQATGTAGGTIFWKPTN